MRVDLATAIGLVGALAVVVGAVALNSSLGAYVNLPSVMIVFGGTAMVVLMKFSLADFAGAFKVAGNAFRQSLPTPVQMIEELLDMAAVARKDGVLALENREISNPFLANAVMMLVDGLDADTISRRLDREQRETQTRHQRGAAVFTAAADVAPAMGMIGTLIGLVSMLTAMDDPKAIGPSMAVALLTTLYGAVLANVIAKPIADKLALRSVEEYLLQAMCRDAVLEIREGTNPRIIESILSLYLAPSMRAGEGDGESVERTEPAEAA